MAAISDDLPALGKPTRPTSATDLSSSTTSRSSPGSPSSANPGALRRVDDERGIAQPAPSALGGDEPRAGADQVGEHLAVAVDDDRPVGHAQLEIGAVGAVAVAARAALAVAGALVRVVVEVEQGVHVRVDDERHVAAAAAVAAVRAAERLELLAVDGRDPVAAVAGSDVQHHTVDETCHDPYPRNDKGGSRLPGAALR